jgi:hypothetical protein
MSLRLKFFMALLFVCALAFGVQRAQARSVALVSGLRTSFLETQSSASATLATALHVSYGKTRRCSI